MSFSLPDFRRKWSCRGYMSAPARQWLPLRSAVACAGGAGRGAKICCAAGYLWPRDTTATYEGALRQDTATKAPPRGGPQATDEAAPEAEGKPSADKPSASKPAEAAPPPEKQLSACRLALTEEIAVAPSIPDIRGPGACGGEDLVRLEAIVLPDKRRWRSSRRRSSAAPWRQRSPIGCATTWCRWRRASARPSAISTISTVRMPRP